MSLLTKGRPKLRAEDFDSGETAVKKLNTQVLEPVYSRLEALERISFVDLVLTTKNPVGNTWPIACPTPPWQVKSILLGNIWNVTANSPEALAGSVQFNYDPTGKQIFIQWINLSAAQQYRITLELKGAAP